MKRVLMKLWKEEEGQDLVEYGLMVALIGLGTVAGMQGVAGSITTLFGSVGNTMTT
jgi:pilus assembly protein Flp/PilA